MRKLGVRKGLGRSCSNTRSSQNDSSRPERLSYHRHTKPAVPFLDPISWKLCRSEAQIRELSRDCRGADGCRNLDDGLLWAALDGRADGWCDANGRAYLAVSQQGRLEFLVHPEWRGRGVGTQLLDRGLERCVALGCAFARTWAYGDLPRTVGWLERRGFQSERVLYRLERTGPPVPAPTWERGWEVRGFRPEDAQPWHELHCSLQSDPTRAWSLKALQRQLKQVDTPASSFWMLHQGTALRGYLWLKGREIFLFALDPAVRGRGLGEKLLAWGLSQLNGQAFVYCDDQRPKALALYHKYGFTQRTKDRCLIRLLTP